MRIFLEEVVLDRPYVVEAQLVGELHLLQTVVVDRALGLARPRARHGNLVEQAEFHPAASLRPCETLGLPAGPRNRTMPSEGETQCNVCPARSRSSRAAPAAWAAPRSCASWPTGARSWSAISTTRTARRH